MDTIINDIKANAKKYEKIDTLFKIITKGKDKMTIEMFISFFSDIVKVDNDFTHRLILLFYLLDFEKKGYLNIDDLRIILEEYNLFLNSNFISDYLNSTFIV